MSKIYYEVGLTDEDSEFFIRSKNNKEGENISYNLKKQQPEIEKAKLVWELLDTPVVRGILDAWEQTIRVPHLLMCHNDIQTNTFDPEYQDHRMMWEYINLVPMQGFDPYELTMEDAELIEVGSSSPFGALYLDYGASSKSSQGDYNSSWRYAVDNNDIDNLRKGPVQMWAVPVFRSYLVLQYEGRVSYDMSAGTKMWMDRKENKLTPLGYYPEDPRCKVGAYRIGNLITPPVEAVEIAAKYKYMCRHSIISEELHAKAKKSSE